MNAFEKRQASVENFVRREDGRASAPEPAAEEFTPLPVEPEEKPAALGATLRSASLPAVVGGLAGAIFAVLAVVAMTELKPPLDPRLPGLAQQVAGFQQSLYSLETTIRGAEADLVRALAADTALGARLDEQSGRFDSAMASIAEARRELKVETGPGSVVFGVSALQLGAAVDGGRPFESEWVNLYALTADHPPLREALSRLMPMASAGVPTIGELQAELRATAAAAGTPVIDPGSMYSYSLNLVQSGLGMPIGTTAEAQVVSGLVTEADRRLAAGDLPGALAVLANLTEQTVVPFETWLTQARRRATADTVVAEFSRVSREALQSRARAGSG